MPNLKSKFSLFGQWVPWILGIWLLPYSYVMSMQRMSENGDYRHGDRSAVANLVMNASTSFRELEKSYLDEPTVSSRRMNLLANSDPDVSVGEGILLQTLALDSSHTLPGQATRVCIDLNNLSVLEALEAEGSSGADRRAHFERARSLMRQSLGKSRLIVTGANAFCPHLGEILLANEKALNLQIRLDY